MMILDPYKPYLYCYGQKLDESNDFKRICTVYPKDSKDLPDNPILRQNNEKCWVGHNKIFVSNCKKCAYFDTIKLEWVNLPDYDSPLFKSDVLDLYSAVEAD